MNVDFGGLAEWIRASALGQGWPMGCVANQNRVNQEHAGAAKKLGAGDKFPGITIAGMARSYALKRRSRYNPPFSFNNADRPCVNYWA